MVIGLRRAGLTIVTGCAILAAVPARADDGFHLVHSFTGLAGGGNPGGVIGHQTGADPQSWALYGATAAGGKGYGIVYKLTPPLPGSTHWIESRLYVFPDTAGGYSPFGALTFDSAGAIYGTTRSGGPADGGTVFRLTPPNPGQYFWNRTVLHEFTFDPDGASPNSGVTLDAAGNVYGTTFDGGNGNGTVYRLTPPASGRGLWTETILHRFSGSDGSGPFAGLIRDPAGILYGATSNGPIGGNRGTVFSLAPPTPGHAAWTFSTLYTFPDADGGFYGPRGNLLRVASGALYGTAFESVSIAGDVSVAGDGAIFRLDPPGPGHSAWTQTILHRFSGPDEAQPGGLAILDGSGALYGATGGTAYAGPDQSTRYSLGEIYKLAPPAAGRTTWTKTVLHTFGPGVNRIFGLPPGTLVTDGAGTIHGTSYFGGAPDAGTAFKIVR